MTEKIREYKMNGSLIIGVDAGYGNFKTARRVFPTAVSVSDKAPVFARDFIEWNGRYYIIGEGHKGFVTDKVTDEVSYFYNPMTPFNLISTKGVFPSVGILNNYANFLWDFLRENYGIIVKDDEIIDDAKPIKYLMKSFPVSSQAASYLPMFYPELAKDLGIRMQSTYGVR